MNPLFNPVNSALSIIYDVSGAITSVPFWSYAENSIDNRHAVMSNVDMQSWFMSSDSVIYEESVLFT